MYIMDILDSVKSFYKSYKGEKGIIGKSLFNIPIYYFATRKGDRPKIIVQYAIHAREYLTALLALKHIADFYERGYNGKVYFIPLVNPDGVKIAEYENVLYKANGRGVDLNVNFDAHWGKGEQNKRVVGDSDYIGEYPFSEPETRALRDFTLLVKPDATISYHAKGEEIYWEFFQEGRLKEINFLLAQKVSAVTGYAIKSTPFSCGGYKDWCIDKLKIPSLTIEVGNDKLCHPLPISELEKVYLRNKRVIFTVCDFMQRYV